MRIDLNKSDYDKLQGKLLKLKEINKTELKTEIYKGALNIARDMTKKAPRDTGNLVDNINGLKPINGAEVRSDAPYSGYVEFGEKEPKLAGKDIPFFYPAINRGLTKIIASVDNKIKRLLK